MTVDPELPRPTHHFLPEHWRLEHVLVTLGPKAGTKDGPCFARGCEGVRDEDQWRSMGL